MGVSDTSAHGLLWEERVNPLLVSLGESELWWQEVRDILQRQTPVLTVFLGGLRWT